MSEHHADDVQGAFRVVLAVIAGIVILGIAVLITVVILYRLNPGRHAPFSRSTPSVTSPQASPSS